MKRAALGIAVIAAIVGTPAFAADMAVKAPPPPPPAVHNWAGFYVGANIGGGWGNSPSGSFQPNDPAAVFAGTPFAGGFIPQPVSPKTSGVIGGLQAGYNWNLNSNWLAGVEADFNWSGAKGSATAVNIAGGGPLIFPFGNTVQERLDWFGTLRARLGYLPTPNLLVFATGGLAYGQLQTTAFTNNPTAAGFTVLAAPFGINCIPNATCLAGSSTKTVPGWSAGGGFEYALGSNWTARAEYLYISLGPANVTETALSSGGNPLPGSFTAATHTNLNIVRAVLNYHF